MNGTPWHLSNSIQMRIDEMTELEIENEPNLGKPERTYPPYKWNRFGGFCDECGGTGRSESGCSPCEYCDKGKV